MNRATIILKDDEWFEVESPYNTLLITLYKQINSKHRYWSPEDKRWGFKIEYIEEVKHWLRNITHFQYDIIQGKSDPLKDQAKIMKEFIRDVKFEILNPEEIRL